VQEEAGAKADAIRREQAVLVSAAKDALSAAEAQAGAVTRSIADLEVQQAEAQAALDKTFFLDFGKKGELGKQVKDLKQSVKEGRASLEKANKAVDGASQAAQKALATADERGEAAEKVVAEAAKASGKITAGAETKASTAAAEAKKKAEVIRAEAARKAAKLEKEANKLSQ